MKSMMDKSKSMIIAQEKDLTEIMDLMIVLILGTTSKGHGDIDPGNEYFFFLREVPPFSGAPLFGVCL